MRVWESLSIIGREDMWVLTGEKCGTEEDRRKILKRAGGEWLMRKRRKLVKRAWRMRK